jgi:hypothetical protein
MTETDVQRLMANAWHAQHEFMLSRGPEITPKLKAFEDAMDAIRKALRCET